MSFITYIYLLLFQLEIPGRIIQ